VTNVVPRRGAVVKATFAASRSEKVVLTVRLRDGGLPPFGTSVLDAKGISVGVVGQAGQVLMAVGESKTFNMKWGDKAAQSCTFELDISQTEPVDGYRVMAATCSVL
jgi:outer membrane usher protein